MTAIHNWAVVRSKRDKSLVKNLTLQNNMFYSEFPISLSFPKQAWKLITLKMVQKRVKMEIFHMEGSYNIVYMKYSKNPLMCNIYSRVQKSSLLLGPCLPLTFYSCPFICQNFRVTKTSPFTNPKENNIE